MDAEILGRRAFARIRVRTEVEVRAAGGGDARPIHGRVRDLSAAGLYVTAIGGLAAGASCEMDIASPLGGPVRAAGKVVRSENGGVAILFTKITTENAARLNQIIAKNPPANPIPREKF
jgi:hypothetical protein